MFSLSSSSAGFTKEFYLFMTVSDVLIGCLLGAFKTSLLKNLIVFVSECQSEGTAENLKRQ